MCNEIKARRENSRPGATNLKLNKGETVNSGTLRHNQGEIVDSGTLRHTRLARIEAVAEFRLPTPIFRLSSSTEPTPKSSDISLSNPFDDEYACGVRSGELARDPLTLARFLASRAVAYGRHFLVIDKPANLSVYGHALSASPLISGATSQSRPLSIYECLPHLRDLLSESNPFSLTDPSDTRHPVSVLVAGKGNKVSKRSFSDAWTPPSEIFIVEPLPAAYSGLILLATSKGYADFARSFYRDATKNTVSFLFGRAIIDNFQVYMR
ncbi:unnamed protein product [Rodentolepis nana]|uniref:Uncharacterized protein n=1 Tax=Rodentolepis nana TaxID=102285 RepID=A0A0R3TZ24_RODNA|nr:unnamed protein product [Rodentolepis nana]